MSVPRKLYCKNLGAERFLGSGLQGSGAAEWGFVNTCGTWFWDLGSCSGRRLSPFVNLVTSAEAQDLWFNYTGCTWILQYFPGVLLGPIWKTNLSDTSREWLGRNSEGIFLHMLPLPELSPLDFSTVGWSSPKYVHLSPPPHLLSLSKMMLPFSLKGIFLVEPHCMLVFIHHREKSKTKQESTN